MTNLDPLTHARPRRLKSTMATMALSSIAASAAIIAFSNVAVDSDQWSEIGSTMELMAITLLPYMISAVVAAVTAIGIMAILPWIRLPEAVHTVQVRLREMAVGDLSTRVQIQGDNHHARQLVRELNCAIGDLSGMIARWKVLDRTQWNLLEGVRLAAQKQDHEEVIRQIELIEKNFVKIGEIHQQVIT